MSLTKSKRFEIFKRDSFTCQYCGNCPPKVTLEVDHIDPRCKGGGDDEINLITSCFQCNRGKGSKLLGTVHPRPDADLLYLKSQQEIMEAKRYLSESRKQQRVNDRVKKTLLDVWISSISNQFIPTDKQWNTWMRMYSPDEIDYGLRQTGPALFRGKFGNCQNQGTIHQAIRYASAIMRNRKQEKQAIQ